MLVRKSFGYFFVCAGSMYTCFLENENMLAIRWIDGEEINTHLKMPHQAVSHPPMDEEMKKLHTQSKMPA